MSSTPQQLRRRGTIATAVDARKVYGTGQATVNALAGVSVEFYQGEFTAIMGPSGSGKSTLMHVMAGLDSLSSGFVSVDGQDVTNMREKQLTKFRRQHIGFIFQQFNLLQTLTAEQNIRLPLDLARKKVDPAWYAEVIRIVGLGDRLHHRPSELSGGQQQRVACARALVGRPSIVFADEPTGNLDSSSSEDVLSFMRYTVDQFGQSLVMVTHEPDAAAYADRVVFLADGQIVAELRNPTTEHILEYMARIRASHQAA